MIRKSDSFGCEFDNFFSSSSIESNDSDFEREVNITRAAYMAYSHVLSRQYVLMKDTVVNEDDDEDGVALRKEMVADMIEQRATVCRDAVALAMKMQRRRQFLRESMQQSKESFVNLFGGKEDLPRRAQAYRERQSLKHRRIIMLKGGLLGFTPNIIQSSHLSDEVAAYNNRRDEKKRRGIMLKEDLLGKPHVYSELLVRQSSVLSRKKSRNQ